MAIDKNIWGGECKLSEMLERLVYSSHSTRSRLLQQKCAGVKYVSIDDAIILAESFVVTAEQLRCSENIHSEMLRRLSGVQEAVHQMSETIFRSSMRED